MKKRGYVSKSASRAATVAAWTAKMAKNRTANARRKVIVKGEKNKRPPEFWKQFRAIYAKPLPTEKTYPRYRIVRTNAAKNGRPEIRVVDTWVEGTGSARVVWIKKGTIRGWKPEGGKERMAVALAEAGALCVMMNEEEKEEEDASTNSM